MKKWILAFVLVLGVGMAVKAQSVYGDKVRADVKMKYISSFEEALKRAKTENKPIFICGFADWAVPCHAMNQVVFSDQKFADWMDEHFVNLIIDIASRDGKPWAKKYNIVTMPQYVMLNPEGEVIFRIVGGHKLPEFQNLISMALNPKTTLPELKRQYDAGERSPKFLMKYIDILKIADEPIAPLLSELFSKVKAKDLPKKEYWKYLMWKSQNDEKDELFKEVMARKAEFVKNNGLEEVNKYLAGIYFGQLYPYACGTKPYNPQLMVDIALDLNKCDLPDTNVVFALYDIAKFRGEKKYTQMVDVLKNRTQGWPQDFIGNIDVCLGELQGLPVEQQNLLVNYLKGRLENLQGPVVKYYQQAIQNLDNKEGIQFSTLNFEQALKQAALEKKLVFMDCYTVWCGPCQKMNRQVFTQKEAGDYFNKHFISLKMDMEKGEGPELGKKYGVEGYPTMFILDTEGQVVGKVYGGRDLKTFMQEIKEIMENR